MLPKTNSYSKNQVTSNPFCPIYFARTLYGLRATQEIQLAVKFRNFSPFGQVFSPFFHFFYQHIYQTFYVNYSLQLFIILVKLDLIIVPLKILYLYCNNLKYVFRRNTSRRSRIFNNRNMPPFGDQDGVPLGQRKLVGTVHYWTGFLHFISISR